MSFYTRWENGQEMPHSLGKILCIGRNYAEHAAELNNPVPSRPLVFIKPATSACNLDTDVPLRFDLGDIHYETELAVQLGASLSRADKNETLHAIQGVGLALDLTLRDVQSALKEKGHPWEIAKGFDNACPLTSFVAVDDPETFFSAAQPHEFTLEVDGEIRQHGITSDMLFTIPEQLAYMSRYFTLEPGDIILTGTPKGVGKLARDQHIKLALDGRVLADARLI